MPWDQSPREVTLALQVSSVDQMDSKMLRHDCIRSIVDELRRNAQLVIDYVDVFGSSQEVVTLFKRLALAHVAVRDLPDGHVGKTLGLNQLLPSVPADGLDELIETTSELHDFYSSVNYPESAMPKIDTFAVDLPT